MSKYKVGDIVRVRDYSYNKALDISNQWHHVESNAEIGRKTNRFVDTCSRKWKVLATNLNERSVVEPEQVLDILLVNTADLSCIMYTKEEFITRLDPPIIISGYEVEFFKDKIKVGCQEVSASQIEEIYKRFHQ